MISGSTRAALGDLITVEAMPGLQLKGVSEPAVGYVVKSIRPREEKE